MRTYHNGDCCAVCGGDDCCGDALCEDHCRYEFCDGHGEWYDADVREANGRVCYILAAPGHEPKLFTEQLCPDCLDCLTEDHPLRLCDMCGVRYGEQMDFAGGATCAGCRAYIAAHGDMLRRAKAVAA